jgi:hypothetical protein
MGSPPDPGKGVEGGSADVAGRWEGGGLESGWVLVGSGRAPKIMGARPHKMGARPHSERAPRIIGARPHLVGGLVISSFSSLQLRVDVSKIRSR